MNKKYVVRLEPWERAHLLDLISAGKAAASVQTHARILLKADVGPDGPGWTDEAIAAALEVSADTVERVRERLVSEGFAAALSRRRAAAPRRRKLDGAAEAHLIALACGEPPAGRQRWTMRLLADTLVALEIVDAIAPETVRQTLKKTSSSRG